MQMTMTIDVTIRNAASKDIPSMTLLLRELFTIEENFKYDSKRQAIGLALLIDGCMKHKCIQVAEVGGDVVGMCTAQILISTAQGSPVALVEDMVVDASYRRKGIGRQLIHSIESWASNHGATRLQLLADQTNTGALEFYKKHGWNRTQLVCWRRFI